MVFSHRENFICFAKGEAGSRRFAHAYSIHGLAVNAISAFTLSG